MKHFDEMIDRKGTLSLKYDFAAERGKPEDLIPLWVADMDFSTPPEVIEALVRVSRHGIFGYSESKEEYFEALYHWFLSRFGWKINRGWLIKTPGVVFAIAAALRALTEKGDAVMIQQPVYYPFQEVIESNERKLINNALVYEEGSYRIDFEDFEEKIATHKVKLFILCSPHNPVGRVWSQEELIHMGDICLKYGVIIVSDEIHADFVYPGFNHFLFPSLKPEFLDITILCTAPSKTFNLAGLQVSNIFIANKEIKRRVKKEIVRTGYSQLNTYGLVACQAAYTYGASWLEELKQYLNENLRFVREFIALRLPQVKLVEPQGTYLVWLDFRQLGLPQPELDDLIIHGAQLWLDSGTMFGQEGEGFQRMNIACPRSVLEKAFLNLERALKNLDGHDQQQDISGGGYPGK